jgi:hypothetical protein
LSITLIDRQASKGDMRRLVPVTLRAKNEYMGRARHADVKVALRPTEDGRTHLFFARCHAFFRDSQDKHYVALQWYTAIGNSAVHPIALLPQLHFAPDNDLASYDVLPVSCIVNGALLIQNGENHWALLSPREQAKYIATNSPE